MEYEAFNNKNGKSNSDEILNMIKKAKSKPRLLILHKHHGAVQIRY
jgi:hypothetical protein